MTTTFKNPSGGISPLGLFAVTAGTAVGLNHNTGPQSEGSLKRANRYQQIIISAPTANTGDIIVLWGSGAAGANPNNVMAIVSPGRAVPLPNGLLVNAKINIDNIYLDSTSGTQAAYGCVAYG